MLEVFIKTISKILILQKCNLFPSNLKKNVDIKLNKNLKN